MLQHGSEKYLNVHLREVWQSFNLINLIIFIVPDKNNFQYVRNKISTMCLWKKYPQQNTSTLNKAKKTKCFTGGYLKDLN